MSGFELDRQVLADKLPAGKELLSQGGQEDVNRVLLSQLKQSSDIARDLASLYSDRPYVYARVMKQLGSVLGNAKVRKLHEEVKSKARALSARAAQSAKSVGKAALKDSASMPGEATQNEGEVDGGAKEVTLNVPALGIVNKKVKLEAESGAFGVECDGWGCPFLNLARAKAFMKGMELDRIELTAGLKGKFIKADGNNSGTVTVHHNSGQFTAEGSLNADLDIPGIEGLSGTFKVGQEGESAVVTAKINSEATMFNKTLSVKSDVDVSVGEESGFSGTLTVNNSKTQGGEGEGGGEKAAVAPQKGGEGEGKEAAGSGPMAFTGTITVAAEASKITSMTGDITVSNLGFLANKEESIKLDVNYDGEGFSASLTSPVKFGSHQLADKKSTVALTINTANYTDEALGADCTVDATVGDMLTVKGNAVFAKNALQSGTLDIDVPKFAVPKENSFVDGSMSGQVTFDSSGFTGATAEAALNLKLGKDTCSLKLEPFAVSSEGVVTGHVEQQETFTSGCITAEQFKCDFSSECETFISSLTGLLRVDHKYLKSDEAGVPLSYDGKEIKANGNLIFMENEKEELGQCVFKASLSSESLKGDGVITLSKDFQVGKSKLQLCKDAQATVGFDGETLNPITFNGKYKYGYPVGGGEGGEGGGAEAGGQEAGGAKGGEVAGKDLKFSGEITNCVFDPETGMLSGSASANLDSTIRLGKDDLFVELEDSFRQSETKLDIAFADNELTNVSGTIVAKAGIKLKTDKLVLEGYLKNFSYDVTSNSFTGLVDVALNENFDLDANKTVVLQGKKQNNVKVTLTANEVTDIEVDVDVELNPKSKMFKGKPKFDCEAKNMKIDPQTGAVNAPSVKVKNANDTVIVMHEKQTELTLLKGSSLETAIVDSEPTFLKGDITYSGETSVLHEGDTKDFKFDGTVNMNIEDVKDPAAGMTGSVKMNVSEDYKIDSIPEVDEIWLLKGTNFDVELTEEGLTDLGGDFTIRYIYNDSENAHLPKGLKLDLKGTDLHYDVPGKLFNGTISVNAVDNIDFNLDSAGKNTFTLVGPASGCDAVITDNKLSSLSGTLGFLAHFSVGEEGAIDVVEGSKATLNIDVSTFAIQDLDVTSNITCDFKVLGAQIKTDAPITADCTVDEEGLSEAAITGAAHLIVPVGKTGNEVDLIVAAGGEGIQYKREGGIDGDITVTCESKSPLGSFNRTGADGAVSSFEYGLGSVGEGGEGGGAAAGFTATVSNSELQKVSGTGGFYLEQTEGSDEPLKVSGNITFDCQVSPDVSLTSATGDVKIERKTLFGSPEALVLGESIAQINIENNQLIGLSGKVELFLNDNSGGDGGDYLHFVTTGEFDCLDTKSFTGDVSANILREKQLGKNIGEKNFGIYLSPEAGDTGFEAKIVDNEIDEMSGSIGVMTKLGEDPFFSGTVNGNYKAASEGVESSLNGSGEITLLKNIDMLNGKFRLCEGSKGNATIENNDISSISGTIIIAIAAPNKSFEESCIKVTSTGTVDVKNAKIEEFIGTAELQGEFEVVDGLSLTSLNASVTIQDNDLKEISGGASIKFAKKGFLIEGGCEQFKWIKGEEGQKDKFSFAGGLSVSGMDGKLSGEAHVSYDTITSENAAPVIDGKLGYQFNSWLGGEIGVRFDGSGWDDPILSGTLKVDNVELIHGRQLLGFNPDPMNLLNMQIQAGPVPITIGAGIGIGASIDLDPVIFSAEFSVEDFHIGKDAGMPKFKCPMSLTSGLSLKASVSPYVKVGIGFGNVLEAGVKLRGVASLIANAGLTLDGLLEGGPDGLAGELGLGFELSGGVTLSVIPSVYATLLGMTAQADICSWDFDLGQLFNFSWGKRFRFDSSGTHEIGGAEQSALDPQTTVDASAEGSEDVGSDYAPKSAPEKQEDGPELPSSKEVADDAGADGAEGGEEAGGFAEKMDQVSKIATAFGNIAEAIGFISELVTAAITGNVAGVVVFLAVKLIKGELDIASIPTKVKEILEGIQALKELIQDNPDFINSLMPDWLKKIIDFFKNFPGIPELLDMVVKKVEEKVAALGSPMDRILQPLVDFVKGQADKIVEIYELFEKGGLSNIVKGIFKVLGLGFSSALDLIDALKSMWGVFCQVVKECVASGDIYVKYEERKGLFGIKYKYYFWQLKIPNLISFSGEGALLDAIAAKAMVGLLSSAGLEAQKKK